MLFETDTGLYLVSSLMIYLIWALLRGEATEWTGRWRSIGGALLGMIVTAFSGIWIASRGTFVRAEFWLGWLEGPRSYAGGMSALLISSIAGTREIVLFLACTGGYLVAAGLAFSRLYCRAAGPRLAVAGTLGVYGLMSMLLFVNRSHPWNLFHPCVPIVALATCLVASAAGRYRGKFASTLPYLAWGLAVGAWAAYPAFSLYPNLIRLACKGGAPPGVTLMPGVRAMPSESVDFASEFADVTHTMSDLHSRGETVGVLDPSDTMFYLASGIPPDDRYTPLPAGAVWKAEVLQRIARLRDHGRDWIAMRSRDGRTTFYRKSFWSMDDTLDEFAEVLKQDYEPISQVGGYTFWRRRSPRNGPDLPKASR